MSSSVPSASPLSRVAPGTKLPVALIEGLGIFLFALVISLSLATMAGTHVIGVCILLAGSLGAVYWTWRHLPWADGDERFFSFGAVLLIACGASRLLYLVDWIFLPDRLDYWPVPDDSPELSVLKGELMTMIGTYLTLGAWWAAGGWKPRLAVQRDVEGRHAYWAIYILSLGALALIYTGVFDADVLGQSAGVMVTAGLASCWFINMDRSHASTRRLLTSMAMVVPFFWVALGFGMKEAIIFSLLPVGIQAWLVFRSGLAKVLLVVVALGIAGWANSFVTFYRYIAWYSNTPITQTEALIEHARGDTFFEHEGTPGWDLTSFITRANASIHRAWAVALTESEGYKPEFVFEPLLYVFVPRFMWPEKPSINPGLEVTMMIFGTGDINSSTATGLYPALYLGAGWIAVILGALFAGLLMALLTGLAARLGGAILANLFGFSLAMVALRFDEGWPVGVFSGPIITLVYLTMLFGIMRFIGLAPTLVRGEPTAHRRGS